MLPEGKGEINSQLSQPAKDRSPDGRGRDKWLWDISKIKKESKAKNVAGNLSNILKALNLKATK